MNLISDIEAGSTLKIKAYSEEKPDAFKEDIKFVDSKGMTPLHYACKHGNLPLVKIILSIDTGKATVNAKDKENGWTPLVYAICSQDDGGPEIVAQLLSHKADPNLKDNVGNTALHHAAGYGAGDAIEFLSKFKESILDAQNNKGETPAHLAIKESQMWAFQILVREGCNVNLMTNNGESLAHYATNSIGNSTQFLRVLASKGANLETRDKNNKRPMDLAKEKKLVRVIAQLKELGAREGETVQPKEKEESKKVEPVKVAKVETKVEKVENKSPANKNYTKLILYLFIMFLFPIVASWLYRVMFKSPKA